MRNVSFWLNCKTKCRSMRRGRNIELFHFAPHADQDSIRYAPVRSMKILFEERACTVHQCIGTTAYKKHTAKFTRFNTLAVYLIYSICVSMKFYVAMTHIVHAAYKCEVDATYCQMRRCRHLASIPRYLLIAQHVLRLHSTKRNQRNYLSNSPSLLSLWLRNQESA